MLKKFSIALSAAVFALVAATSGAKAAVQNINLDTYPYLQSFDNDVAGGIGAGGDTIDDTINFTAVGAKSLKFEVSVNHPNGTSLVGISDLIMSWSVDGGAVTPLTITNTGGTIVLLATFFQSLMDGEVGTLQIDGDRLANGGGYTLTVSAVPLPPSVIAFTTAMLGVGFLARRRRKNKAVF